MGLGGITRARSNSVALTNTTRTSLIAAAGGQKTYLGNIIATNSHATVGTNVFIYDGTSTTAAWGGWCAPAGGGWVFNAPMNAAMLEPAAQSTAWNVACDTSGASVVVCAAGVQDPN